jgi:hypothetical protein
MIVFLWVFACVLFFGTEASFLNKEFPGMPLDDTWIHFTFARNLSQYGSFGLNPGEFSGGATSPLWVLILALAYGLTHQMFFSALALGALFTLLTALSVYHLVCDLTKNKNVSFFAAAFSLVSGRFLWGSFSGMEVPLFAFLTVQAIYWHQRFILLPINK